MGCVESEIATSEKVKSTLMRVEYACGIKRQRLS